MEFTCVISKTQTSKLSKATGLLSVMCDIMICDAQQCMILHYIAIIADSRTVSVDGVSYTADHILVAVGGQPALPNTPGAELGITSDGFFDLTDIPKYT